MYDVTLLAMLLVLSWLAWRQPWIGVLGLAFLIGMQPQGYSKGYMWSFPIYLFLFVVVVAATFTDHIRCRAWPKLFWDWRLGAILALWGVFFTTTVLAMNPGGAWPQMVEVGKMLPTLALVLLLIDSREKLFYMNVTLALSVAAVVLKGGFWALITGFSDRVYGPPGSQFGDNNEFAVAVAMMLPMLMLWFAETEDRRQRWLLAVLMALGFVAALSSWSRGGLLSLSVVTALLFWQSRRKWLALPLLLVGLGLMFMALPDAWFQRMGDFGRGQLDASAAERLAVWHLGREYIQEHPWFGGGFGGWVYLSLSLGRPIDWHSAYVKMAAEHGLVGLTLWLVLLVGSLWMLTRLIGRNRRWRIPWLSVHAAMIRASIAAYMTGAAFLGIPYWELLYLMIISAVLLERFANLEMREMREAQTQVAGRPHAREPIPRRAESLP